MKKMIVLLAVLLIANGLNAVEMEYNAVLELPITIRVNVEENLNLSGVKITIIPPTVNIKELIEGNK